MFLCLLFFYKLAPLLYIGMFMHLLKTAAYSSFVLSFVDFDNGFSVIQFIKALLHALWFSVLIQLNIKGWILFMCPELKTLVILFPVQYQIHKEEIRFSYQPWKLYWLESSILDILQVTWKKFQIARYIVNSAEHGR